MFGTHGAASGILCWVLGPLVWDMLAKCGECSWGLSRRFGPRKLMGRKMERDLPQRCTRAVVTRCSKKNLEMFSVWSSPDPGFPEKFRNHHPWRYLGLDRAKPWAVWCKLEVGPTLSRRLDPYAFRGPFQPDLFPWLHQNVNLQCNYSFKNKINYTLPNKLSI